MNFGFWALILALVALVLGAIGRRRERLTAFPMSASSGARSSLFWLAPIAIIIGVLPGVLRLGSALRLAGSLLSLTISLTAIVLLSIGRRKA